jgi:hypothetical protein
MCVSLAHGNVYLRQALLLRAPMKWGRDVVRRRSPLLKQPTSRQPDKFRFFNVF